MALAANVMVTKNLMVHGKIWVPIVSVTVIELQIKILVVFFENPIGKVYGNIGMGNVSVSFLYAEMFLEYP